MSPRRLSGAIGHWSPRHLFRGDAVLGGAPSQHDDEDLSLWADAWPDRALVQALQSATDNDAVFEYGLNALLAPLRR